MHSKELFSDSKVVKKHKKQSKRKSSKDLIKKIIPRSGSYDLNPFLNESYYEQTNKRQNKGSDSKLDNETLSSEALTTTTTSNLTDISSNYQTENKNNFINKNTYYPGNGNNKIMNLSYLNSPIVELPKKRTCLGFPILCFAYVAAIYSLVNLIYLNFE